MNKLYSHGDKLPFHKTTWMNLLNLCLRSKKKKQYSKTTCLNNSVYNSKEEKLSNI